MTTLSRTLLVLMVVAVFVGLVQLPTGRGQETENPSPGQDTILTEDSTGDAPPVSVAEARRQAILLHAAMHTSLQLVHHELYREDEGLPLPAAVFNDVFAELSREQGVVLRWLAVEGVAMNSDHSPQNQFERDSVDALKAGKTSVETFDSGVYRRAARITLTNACLKCHVPDRKSTDDRTAGLIISIPAVME
jgi:Protein of unknown function (DUF3365)